MDPGTPPSASGHNNTKLLTLRAVARTLDVSRTTVRRLIQERELAAFRFRSVIRVRPQDLDAFVAKAYRPAK